MYIRRTVVPQRRREGNVLRVERREPRYPPILWNQYEAVLEGTARTNNLSEGWHNRFQIVVGKHHPSLYAFLDELRKERRDVEIMISQMQIGQKIRRGAGKKRQQKKEQLYNVVGQYEEYYERGEIIDYLKNVGFNIHM